MRITEGVIRIEEEQTTQWPKEKGQTTIYKHTYKTKYRVTRTQLKTRGKYVCENYDLYMKNTNAQYIPMNYVGKPVAIIWSET